MAKKAKPPTPEQLQKLSEVLFGTCKNIYTEATKLGFTATDETFDLLKKGNGGIFRCEECSQWIEAGDESDNENICRECCENINKDN